MAHFIVYRLDRKDGEAGNIRATTRPAHRDYMTQFGPRVLIGGPILDEAGNAQGGMMVIEAESRDEVERIIAADPFEQAGLSTTIHIAPFRWQTNRPAHLPPLAAL
ncbi:MAG TPA: YciI family protein [Paracoccus sp. (in: a-proteobacteria)]|uniref:YciI family protein n=1 Tax=Paracoccus sp. TaxID=267 RepID=UPI002C5B1C1F|nr:YciI family protein [Paracoccus sp. (in: a-proteobacteria)]HWL57455.1 YciI family protein [Paracoccus sp. (in: a-proteobacteria)]